MARLGTSGFWKFCCIPLFFYSSLSLSLSGNRIPVIGHTCPFASRIKIKPTTTFQSSHCYTQRYDFLYFLFSLKVGGVAKTTANYFIPVVGSPRYASPEMLSMWVDAYEDFDILLASDIYSFSLIMWEILVMCPVGQGERERERERVCVCGGGGGVKVRVCVYFTGVYCVTRQAQNVMA